MLCRDGVQSEWSTDLLFISTWLRLIAHGFCRCFSPAHDLSVPRARRTREIDELVVEHWDSKELWELFGIVAEVTVSCQCEVSILLQYSDDGTSQPYTHNFPRADIHELLSPDLLHQVIKGTFKDHIVAWVEEYIYSVPNRTKKEADDIMDDIDERYATSSTGPFPPVD